MESVKVTAAGLKVYCKDTTVDVNFCSSFIIFFLLQQKMSTVVLVFQYVSFLQRKKKNVFLLQYIFLPANEK